MPVMALVAPGPEGDQHHAGLTGGAGIAVSGMGRGLLVAHQDMGHLAVLEQGIVNMQNSAAGIAENVLDPSSSKARAIISPPDNNSTSNLP